MSGLRLSRGGRAVAYAADSWSRRAMQRARIGAWLAAASFLLLPQICAARVPTRLVYARAQSAKDCPDESALVQAVAARLGYDPFSPWGDQTILATVSRPGVGVLGHAELIDHDGMAQGSREVSLQSGDCHELILALSLAISITLDPLHVETPPDEPNPQPAAVSTVNAKVPGAAENVASEAATATPPHDEPRRPASPKPASASWHVGAGALSAYGLAPRVMFGARAGIEARRARWSVALEGWNALPAAWGVEGGGEIRTSLWAGTLAPCFAALTRLRLCALGSIGSLGSQSLHITLPRSEHVLHASAGGRASFAWPLGQWFELVASAEVAAVLHRPRFELDDVVVWRPSALLATAGISVSARFF